MNAKFIIYCFITTYALIAITANYRYYQMIDTIKSYDLDKNGFINNDEITVEATSAVYNSTRFRNPNNLRGYLLMVPYSMIFTALLTLLIQSTKWIFKLFGFEILIRKISSS